MSSHGPLAVVSNGIAYIVGRPAGACIPVASASPIHVFPIQHVLKTM